ncbi:hypothetical protein M8818_007423 [Zalaria obscura]|uniref:Uncharacterized protein n=1 Tax=Zalaria obscura TaxID=2024903 RepID=A0ACC3S625_9PEZI
MARSCRQARCDLLQGFTSFIMNTEEYSVAKDSSPDAGLGRLPATRRSDTTGSDLEKASCGTSSAAQGKSTTFLMIR